MKLSRIQQKLKKPLSLSLSLSLSVYIYIYMYRYIWISDIQREAKRNNLRGLEVVEDTIYANTMYISKNNTCNVSPKDFFFSPKAVVSLSPKKLKTILLS